MVEQIQWEKAAGATFVDIAAIVLKLLDNIPQCTDATLWFS